MTDLFEAWGRALVRHRLAGLVASLALTALALAAIGLRVADGLPVDFTPQALFMDGGPEISRLEQLEEGYGREDNDVVLLVEGPLATAEGVDSLIRLHEAVEALPVVEEVDSLVNASMVIASAGMIEVVSPLERWPPAEALERAASDPALAGLVVAEDQTIAAVRVRIDRDLERVADLGPAVREVVQTAQGATLAEGITVRPTGVPFIRSEVVDLMVADELRFLPLVAVLFALATGVLFRRFWSGLAPLFVTLAGTIWAMGVLMASGATLNVLSVLVPTLTVVIGVSDGVHIVARYREELDPEDGSAVTPEQAMGTTLRHMTAACFLTTFTTAAGFLSLLVAETRVVRDFGVHCAVAVMVVWVSVMLVLPVWLAWIPPARVGKRLQSEVGTRQIAWLDRLVARHSGLVLAGSLLLVAVAAGLGSGVRAQSSILEMYHPSHPTWQAVHAADTRLGGIVPVMVHVELPPGAQPDALLDPSLLVPMATLQDELEARPEVGWTTSPASLVRQIHGMLTGQPGLPDNRPAVVQELLLAEMSGELPLDRILSGDRTSGRILVLTRDAGGRALLQLQRDTQARAAQLFDGTGAHVDVTGDGFVASAGVERLVSDLVNSVGLVLVVIVLTMWALLRDLRVALICAIPNVVPLVFTAATLALMNTDLQLTNIVSFTVAVGLAVDDTIHFVARYREERAHGADLDAAITNAYHGAGRAIILTSLLLVTGFGVLAWSDLTSTRFFGILSAVTMAAALFADLLLLPALLHLLGRRQAAGSRAPG